MKFNLVVLLCVVHVSCGSLLEESFADDAALLKRTRKDGPSVSDSKCVVSNFDEVQDLDLGRLTGDWYEAFRTATSVVFRSGIWRLQGTQKKDSLLFTFAAKLMSDQCMPPIQGTISVPDSSPSTIRLNYAGLKGKIEEEFKVVHTDHKNILILYGCQHFQESGECLPDASVLVILSKYRSLSEAVLDNMRQWSEKVCVDVSALIEQDSIGSCNLDQLDPERWKDSQTASKFACKETAPCTLACPPCCEEREDSCIRCECQNKEQNPMLPKIPREDSKVMTSVPPKDEDGCVHSLEECKGTNCQLLEKRPGCKVCSCSAPLKAAPIRDSHVKTITDVRECPTSCRTKTENDKLLCDCSNKVICQPIPPNVPGSCPDKEERYYFDDRTGTCHAFYGACLDNTNNFKTLKDCIDVCAEVCELPLDPGRCEADGPMQKRFYFNRNRGVCDEFVYGGCGGNANNYESEAMCKHQCPEWMDDSSTKRRPDKCYQHPVKGHCHESEIRYFFLNITKTCTSFFYTGCGEGPNHFNTLKDCEDTCSGNLQSPKQCPDVSNCPCSPTLKEDDCQECSCGGDQGTSIIPCTVLVVSLLFWLAVRS